MHDSKQTPLTPAQHNAMATLITQANWFSGYFVRQADRVMKEPVNER